MKHYRAILDFFAENFPGKRVSLEPLAPYGRARADQSVAPPDRVLYAEMLVSALEYGANIGVEIRNSHVSKFQQIRTCFCGAVGVPNWTVAADGRLISCTRDCYPSIFDIGRFDPETMKFLLDEEKLHALRKMNVFEYQECQDCFCKYNCAGDCPDLRIENLHNCEATRQLGLKYLEKMVDGGQPSRT
jgi:uncharacterized protein